tara:strand:+ start:3590 stop:5848 length:2259 start_codon:yes stop_codon:yes gene_type:complete
MSEKGIDYGLTSTFGDNKRLLVFYDFSGMSGRHIGNELDDGINYGVIENCEPAANTGLYSGVVVGLGSTVASAKQFTTGIFLAGDQAHLNESNIKVTGTSSLPYSACSILVDVEFNGDVSDCVLFGSLEKTSTTINEEVVTGAKGYNVGINDRGSLFYQGFSDEGDFIYTANSIELAKRNIIGFSMGGDNLNITRLDYLNNKIQTQVFSVDSSFIANNEEFYLGGSHQYFRGGPAGPSGEFKTSNLSLNSFCLLSGYIPPSALFSVGSGLIGNYFIDEGTTTFKRQITGYDQTIVYKTGITGYDYENTGSINISTGTYMFTGSYLGTPPRSVDTGEGDRYFVYRSFDSALSDSGVKTFVKEEVGFLDPSSGYQYLPTGEQAFATLGLQNVEGAVLEYFEQRGISGAATVAVQLFGSRFQTGILSGISGVIQTPLYQTDINKNAVGSSGIRVNCNAQLLKKNYIFHIGEKLLSDSNPIIYDSVLSTGTASVSGCSSSDLGTDTSDVLNKTPAGAKDKFFFKRALVTGEQEIQLSVDGQTLFQEVPLTGQAVNKVIYQTKTGDFFTKDTGVSSIDRATLFFDSSTPVGAESKLKYNLITGGIFAGTGDYGSSLGSGISGRYTASAFTDYDYFLNGQKVYSGIGVGISAGVSATNFYPLFVTSMGGVVTDDNKNEFKYTAYRKRDRITSITGENPNVFSNTGFIEGRTNFYINGLVQPQNSYIELYTGVTIIASGSYPSISGGLGENLVQESLIL